MTQSYLTNDIEPHSAEEARLREIADLRLTDEDAGGALQVLAERAARTLGTEIGLVTIVLDQAQYFAASHGLTGWQAEAGGGPVEWSFCAHAVRSGKPFVVPNATEHPDVRDNPVVRQDGLRCYAGVPLVTSKGHAVGTVCVAGYTAREFSREDMAHLDSLADQAVNAIERRRRIES
jgi:GAF domain-containing protein